METSPEVTQRGPGNRDLYRGTEVTVGEGVSRRCDSVPRMGLYFTMR